MSTDTNVKTNRLKPKDFITVGIFTAILFVVEFACGMLGYIHPFIVATHDPELIEMCCDYLLCIENGKTGYMKRL